jgi:hypothetical protein
MQGDEHMCGRYGAGADRSHALPPLVCEIVAAPEPAAGLGAQGPRSGAEVGAMSAPRAGLQAAGGADNRQWRDRSAFVIRTLRKGRHLRSRSGYAVTEAAAARVR